MMISWRRAGGIHHPDPSRTYSSFLFSYRFSSRLGSLLSQFQSHLLPLPPQPIFRASIESGRLSRGASCEVFAPSDDFLYLFMDDLVTCDKLACSQDEPMKASCCFLRSDKRGEFEVPWKKSDFEGRRFEWK